MQLERPLLAGAVALAALVLLAILERLRRRPVVLVVASLDLFPESAVVASAAARSRRREWRDLVLRALAALAFSLAAGGPSVEAGERGGRRVRVVLGRGASLAAREPGGRTRLDLARDELRRALERLAPEDRVDLTLLPPGPDAPAAGLSPVEAIRALASVPAVAAPGELSSGAAALAAAASDLAHDPARALPALVVLDREPAPGSVPRELLAAARVALVGSPLANRAIVALASGRDELGRERLLCAVASFSDQPSHVGLELRFAREPGAMTTTPRVFELELGPGETRSVVIDDVAALASTQAVEARLTGDDPLELDDRVLALRSTLAPVRVAIAGDLGRPVETALRSCEGVTVELFPEGQAPARGFDLTVLRAERDDEPAPLGACVFVCPPRDDAVAPRELALGPRAALVRSAADQGSGVDLLGSLGWIKRARPAPPSNLGALEAVVEAVVEARPPLRVKLIAASPEGRGGSLAVYLGFDTRSPEVEDHWARDPSFPRFWAELVERVRERPDEPPALEVEPTGRGLVLPRPADASASAPLEVVPPGEPPRARRARARRYVPLEVGLHRVRAEGAPGEALFSAALLDSRTSDLRHGRSVPFDEETLGLLARRDAGGARASVAGVVALLGLVFAAVAWLLAGRLFSPQRR